MPNRLASKPLAPPQSVARAPDCRGRPATWRAGAGAAAGLAGVALCLGGDPHWMDLAGLFLASLGLHLWVISRQRL
ncbi:hypothetical protein BKK81_29580 [Cupriavidus sp. USMAHM13]|uniref:hypothetical protein n=1 Tax=Cupriavidus sp. USMAHM13 TaxID=1389192 RepID=UPI0008A6E52A|nr:hypothetical protein [Cupriavidus sp. USMAHM13]AOZ03250.1 hypothetical protein BKK81_29580 [Cupriavidus sp. USMAHM13]